MIPSIIEISAAKNDLWEALTTGSSTNNKNKIDREENFKKCLSKEVGGDLSSPVCMITGIIGKKSDDNSSNTVVTAHIIPHCIHKQPDKLKKCGYTKDDIDCFRNGLFLATEIEKEFDKKNIGFIEDPDPYKKRLEVPKLVMKVFNEDCRTIKIASIGNKIIGDYDGFPLNCTHDPFKTALSLHAFHCFLKAELSGNVDAPKFLSSPERVTNYLQGVKVHLDYCRKSIKDVSNFDISDDGSCGTNFDDL